MPRIRIHTFGAFTITQSGRVAAPLGIKEKALIAFLCADPNRRFRREYLADLLWQSSSERRAKHSLSQAVYSIRRAVPDLLIADHNSIKCNEAEVLTDLEQFRVSAEHGDLSACASVVRGPFLDDLALLGSPAFEEWRDNFARNVFYKFQLILVDKLRNMNEHRRQQALSSLPFAFLELFPALTPLLIEADTSGEMGLFGYQVESDGPDLGADPLQTPFIGRDSQLFTLEDLWRKSQLERHQFALVTGGAGFGKTRLLAEFAARVEQAGGRVLVAHCYEAERAIDFGAITGMLTGRLDASVTEQIAPIWRDTLGQLFPYVAGRSQQPPLLSASASQSRVYEAILRVFEQLSKTGPLALIIDDVQWCDRSTRALLSYVFHRAQGSGMLFVAAMRTTRDESSVSEPWKSWKQIIVKEFTSDELTALIEYYEKHNCQGIHSAEKLRRLTAGHPYLVAETFRSKAFVGQGKSQTDSPEASTSIELLLDSMLDGVPVGAQNLIAVLAVLAKPCSLDLIQRVAQRKNISKTLDELASRGIITVSKRVRFRHDLLREAAYARVPILTRLEMHRRAAHALAKMNGDAGQTAAHYYRARLRGPAFKFALLAVEEADRRSAAHESVHYLRLAIKSAPKGAPNLRVELADRLYRLNRLADARRELTSILSMESFPPRDALEHRIFDLELGYALGDISGEEVRRTLTEVISQLRARDGALLHRAVRLRLRSALNDGARNAAASDITELRRLAIRDLDGADGIESLGLAVHAHGHFFSVSEATAWAQPLVARSGIISDHELRVRTLRYLGALAYESGKLRDAQGLYDTALREIDAVGAISNWPFNAAHAHMVLVERGDFIEAKELAREIRIRVTSIDGVHTLAVMNTNEAMMFYEMDDLGAAQETANAALHFLSRFELVFPRIGLLGLSGLIALEQGDLATARDLAHEARSRLDVLGMRASEISPAEILIARLDTMLNRRTQAIARLRDAIREYQDRDVLCRLKMQLELARLLKPVDAAQARHEARQVFDVAQSIGARPLAERADALLHRF